METDKDVHLDLSNQDLTSIPENILSLENVISVNLSEGNNIQVSDKYKLIDSVPSITTIDGKDISNIRTACNNLIEIFVRRLQELFLTKKATEIYNEQSREQVRITKMVNLAKKTITDGPSALTDFKDYKLEKLIMENYDEYVSNSLEANLKLKGKENGAPTSKKAKKSLAFKTKKHHSKRSASSPSKRNRLPIFQLNHLLQTHQKDNDPKDFHTKVWMCEFEPDLENPSKTTNLVATCGGDSICFIDCTTGTVLKKYKEPLEEFYCISWTSLTLKNELTGLETKVSLLAAAGILGDVKLIDPSNLLCYQQISHHQKPIDAILFNPMLPNYMFTGSEDRTIVMWDLGNPYSTDTKNATQKLTLLAGTSGTVRQIAICPHGKILMAACDDGLYAWNVTLSSSTSEKSVERVPEYCFEFGNDKKPLDSANCLTNDLLAVKRVHDGVIHIFWSPTEFLQNDSKILYSLTWRKTETPFLKFNYSLGNSKLVAGDDRGYIWMYDLKELILASKLKKNVEGFALPKAEKLRCHSDHGKIFNHVAMSSSGKYMVAVTDANVVAIWKLV